MDREAVVKQMKELKAKAKKARREGKRAIAGGFRGGMQRLQRKLKASAPRLHTKKTAASDAGPPSV